ncbi:MAG: efflux RND transporter periplasmic adaptor subunit [Anaerolineae bacterium]|nr:efflux RND transporter periplasmic adaptor subunit [Anaerolineae bacterium]
MKHRIVPIIIILIIIGAAAGGYWYFSQNPAEFTRLQVELGLLTETEASGIHSASGFIEAEEISAAAEIGGRITRIAVAEGDFVEAGQVLVELDTALLETELAQAKAKIETANAQLDQINAGIRAEEIAKAEAAVAVAEAKAEAAHVAWADAIMLRDNPQELDMQIDAAKTALELAELKIAYAIPLKNAAEALYALGEQGWQTAQEGIDWSVKLPTGNKKSGHYTFPEGFKQDASMAWNLAGADQWQAWVDLNSAVVERDDAETALNDLIRLRNDPQEAQIQVDQAEAAYEAALAEVGVAQAQLEMLKAGARPEQVAVAEAQVQQTEAALASLGVQYDKHTLLAPAAGWVVKKVAHEGEMAVPGMSLLTLADLTNVTLTVYVPEPDIGKLSLGQKVEVFVDSFPGEAFTGHITYISDEAEFTPKNVQTKEERVNTVFAVKIKLDNPDQRLKPGMPADAVLSRGQPEL